MAKGFLKLPTYKRFNYTPRYFEGKKQDQNLYDFDSAIRRNRDSVNYNDFRAHWGEARTNSRHRGNRQVTFRLLLIVVTLILVFLYIIDFDISIFSKK